MSASSETTKSMAAVPKAELAQETVMLNTSTLPQLHQHHLPPALPTPALPATELAPWFSTAVPWLQQLPLVCSSDYKPFFSSRLRYHPHLTRWQLRIRGDLFLTTGNNPGKVEGRASGVMISITGFASICMVWGTT